MSTELKKRYDRIINSAENELHFKNLALIAKKISPNYIEGGTFFGDNNPDVINNDFLTKRINLFHYATYAQNIIEIGFNTGHSCLLMLLANSKSKIQIFDLGLHLYVKECFEYLDKLFPDRLSIIYGDSTQTCSKFVSNTNDKDNKYDLIHLDGGHSLEVLSADMNNMRKVSSMYTIVIIDDISFHSKHMIAHLSDFVIDKLITEEIIQIVPPYFSNFHIICKYNFNK